MSDQDIANLSKSLHEAWDRQAINLIKSLKLALEEKIEFTPKIAEIEKIKALLKDSLEKENNHDA